MLTRALVQFRRVGRWFSRSYWAVRLLNLEKFNGSGEEPGLLLIQIDGLPYTQFRRAMKDGNLPFLRRLATREKYREHSFYSGLPSATPAVQGELFYGVKGCVPAFHFLDNPSGKIFTMYDPDSVNEMEKRLQAAGGPGLLEGGSSYSNIYAGGAQESHFCANSLSWKLVFKLFNPRIYPIAIFFHFDVVLRTILLLIIEFFLAVWDSIRGALAGHPWWMEGQFILTRVFLCIVLREVIVARVLIDIHRGLPVIHANFFGFDEQSHRRGPHSDFAHWVLRGIDDSIRRIYKAARRADRRDYDVWFYSDHGQEHTTPYSMLHGKKIEDVVVSFVKEINGRPEAKPEDTAKTLPEALEIFTHSVKEELREAGITITGMGPLAHLYFEKDHPPEFYESLMKRLLQEAHAPVIFYRHSGEKIEAWTKDGKFTIPENAAEILGQDHPFLAEVSEDLTALCRHASAGKLIIAGWRKSLKPTTFPIETGSHASFGPEETHGFALMPQDVDFPKHKKYIRATDIRQAALRYLGKQDRGEEVCRWEAPLAAQTFRIMTYNVHGCVGMDGKLMPERIARVIARHDVDAICLQELDVKRKRSRSVDQAELIAQKLQMKHHFHPSFVMEDEEYGNAILSRYPVKLIKIGSLPRSKEHRHYEPRGAIWAEIDICGRKIQLLNTHLSIWPGERLLQIRALLGPEWLGASDAQIPFILCGDFNAGPTSPVYRLLAGKLTDAQKYLKTHQPGKTWFGPYPLARIDHVFMNPKLEVVKVTVPRTDLDKVASDHLPLIVEFKFSGENLKEPMRDLKSIETVR